jgi:sulfur-oxidizing protein SoxB
MVRVGGMTYACEPAARMGARISDMKLGNKLMEASKTFKVAGWAPVAEGASGPPVWELVERYLKDRKTIAARAPSLPRLIGVEHNPGLA